jgi:hypothetical protein
MRGRASTCVWVVARWWRSEDGRLATLDVLDLHRACELGAGALEARARTCYLGERRPVGCPR